MGQERSNREPASIVDAFLIECLAWGLLQAHGVKGPPMPVWDMVREPLALFGRLRLLGVDLGLYDAAYRSCLDGSQVIAVDLTRSRPVQRASIARALYVAFCASPRAAELEWPRHTRPQVYGDLFARCLLMPAVWVRDACTQGIPPAGLIDLFDVPVSMVSRRLGDVGLSVLSVSEHEPGSGYLERRTYVER